jgi:hypothetical protein
MAAVQLPAKVQGKILMKFLCTACVFLTQAFYIKGIKQYQPV